MRPDTIDDEVEWWPPPIPGQWVTAGNVSWEPGWDNYLVVKLQITARMKQVMMGRALTFFVPE